MPEQKQQPLDEPKGKQTGRRYRILAFLHATEAEGEPEEATWIDFGWHPGNSPQSAIKAARGKHPGLRKLIATGTPVLPVAEGDFNPLIVTIETVEREAFKKADL